MTNRVAGFLFTFALLACFGAAAGESLTVNSILTANHSGAPTDGIVALIEEPANSVTLRNAGLAEAVILRHCGFFCRRLTGAGHDAESRVDGGAEGDPSRTDPRWITEDCLGTV